MDQDIQDQLYEMRMNFYATNLLLKEIILLIEDGDEEAEDEDWEEIKERLLEKLRLEGRR